LLSLYSFSTPDQKRVAVPDATIALTIFVQRQRLKGMRLLLQAFTSFDLVLIASSLIVAQSAVTTAAQKQKSTSTKRKVTPTAASKTVTKRKGSAPAKAGM